MSIGTVRGRTCLCAVAFVWEVAVCERAFELVADLERGADVCPGLSACIGSVGIPCCEVNERVGRRTGRGAGSVALHRMVSPFSASRILVRRIPHSVELHCDAVEVRGLVHCSQIFIPISRNCSMCSVSRRSD